MAAQIIISARTGDPSACPYNGTVQASHRTERYHYNLQHFISGLIRVFGLIPIPKSTKRSTSLVGCHIFATMYREFFSRMIGLGGGSEVAPPR